MFGVIAALSGQGAFGPLTSSGAGPWEALPPCCQTQGCTRKKRGDREPKVSSLQGRASPLSRQLWEPEWVPGRWRAGGGLGDTDRHLVVGAQGLALEGAEAHFSITDMGLNCSSRT